MGEDFKERMRRLRLRAGLRSQREAAEAIGCERGTVGMWEAPSSAVDAVGGEYLMATARAYKVRPDYLISGKGDDGYPWEDAASQTVILDPEMIADVASSLHDVFSELGMPAGVEYYPDLFAKLYQERTTMGGVLPGRLAAAVSRWVGKHGGVDGRASQVPAPGTHKGDAGGRRKAKR